MSLHYRPKQNGSFRGSIAPASLKHRCSPGHRRTRRGFPGLYCPGLIEAVLPALEAAAVLEKFPGLYCPGLIEAPTSTM